ncbi:MAG: proline dehydrogenase family protein [Inhella sp.]
MGGDGISIKLSALFTRYEVLQRERVFATLVPRVQGLVDAAAAANMNLTIDAEEVDRLELSLDVFEALTRHIAAEHPQWRGWPGRAGLPDARAAPSSMRWPTSPASTS